MQLYNTLTRTKENFTPQTETVTIYACGPTVYNLIHVGNARPLCVFDVLRRYLEYLGYKVNFVQNFTDVDDKIIKKSAEEKIPLFELTEKYIAEYYTDARGLNVEDADTAPKVTDHISDIIALIEKIIANGFAYEKNGDVYFSVRKFENYGKLSKKSVDDLESGARVDINEIKEDPLDFAVWKKSKEGEPFWDSPWSGGRPGWHIECSAMSMKYLGETLDIHCGGQDLIFPHHSNEIAQSEAATGKKFSNFWLHNGFIDIDGVKMSKSLENFKFVREAAKEYGYETIRFLLIQAHYRSPINFTEDILNSCKTSIERLYNCQENVNRALEEKRPETFENDRDFSEVPEKFKAAMDDDLNTAAALSVIFDFVRELNTLSRGDEINKNTSQKTLKNGLKIFKELTAVLGLLYADEKNEIPQEILELVERRKAARKEKNFAIADEIRERIANLGYTLQETRQGTFIVKN